MVYITSNVPMYSSQEGPFHSAILPSCHPAICHPAILPFWHLFLYSKLPLKMCTACLPCEAYTTSRPVKPVFPLHHNLQTHYSLFQPFLTGIQFPACFSCAVRMMVGMLTYYNTINMCNYTSYQLSCFSLQLHCSKCNYDCYAQKEACNDHDIGDTVLARSSYQARYACLLAFFKISCMRSMIMYDLRTKDSCTKNSCTKRRCFRGVSTNF